VKKSGNGKEERRGLMKRGREGGGGRDFPLRVPRGGEEVGGGRRGFSVDRIGGRVQDPAAHGVEKRKVGDRFHSLIRWEGGERKKKKKRRIRKRLEEQEKKKKKGRENDTMNMSTAKKKISHAKKREAKTSPPPRRGKARPSNRRKGKACSTRLTDQKEPSSAKGRGKTMKFCHQKEKQHDRHRRGKGKEVPVLNLAEKGLEKGDIYFRKWAGRSGTFFGGGGNGRGRRSIAMQAVGEGVKKSLRRLPVG